jgi:hypothetical protein
MAMELTEKILQGMKGYLGITVAHPDIEGKLRVCGATADPTNFTWADMPDSFRVPGRQVYCCQAAGSDKPVFVFGDEVTVVDAPAYLVVGQLLDMIADIRTSRSLTPYDVIDILEGRSLDPDEWDDDVEEED